MTKEEAYALCRDEINVICDDDDSPSIIEFPCDQMINPGMKRVSSIEKELAVAIKILLNK